MIQQNNCGILFENCQPINVHGEAYWWAGHAHSPRTPLLATVIEYNPD